MPTTCDKCDKPRDLHAVVSAVFGDGDDPPLRTFCPDPQGETALFYRDDGWHTETVIFDGDTARQVVNS